MKWQTLIAQIYERMSQEYMGIVDGLTLDEVNKQPYPDCNSIGWLAWHLTRQQDAQIAALMGEEQLWLKDKWYLKFERQPEAGDIGFGQTPEQVSAFKSPEAKTLLDYNQAVVERSKQYIRSLSGTDLDRELNEPWFQPPPTVGVRLISILDDSILHTGQAAYVRGLRQGRGWQKY